jgi:hypothetical protein
MNNRNVWIHKLRGLRHASLGLGLLFVVAAFVSPAVGANVRVITETARIRSLADFQGPVVAEVAKGTILESFEASGSWLRVRLAARPGRPAVEGFILKNMVVETEETAGPAPQATVRARPQIIAEPASERSLPPAGRAPLLSGFSLKFGLQTAPPTGGIGMAWSLGAGYDHPLARNFSLGAEIHLAFRSSSDSGFNLKVTSIPVLALASGKVALGVGDLIRGLDFLTLLAGAGGGAELTFATITIDGNSTSHASFFPALHGFIGVLADLGSVRLTLDFQMVTVLNPDIDPDGWRSFLRFGIRL